MKKNMTANEKIKELAEQAEKYALDKANEGDDEDFDYSFDDDFQEKFAELIVRECAEFVSNDRMNDEYGQFVANRIKQHFGVE